MKFTWRTRERIRCWLRGGHKWSQWMWGEERIFQHASGRAERVRMRSRRCLRCGHLGKMA